MFSRISVRSGCFKSLWCCWISCITQNSEARERLLYLLWRHELSIYTFYNILKKQVTDLTTDTMASFQQIYRIAQSYQTDRIALVTMLLFITVPLKYFNWIFLLYQILTQQMFLINLLVRHTTSNVSNDSYFKSLIDRLFAILPYHIVLNVLQY